MPLQTGTRLGVYEVLALLGAGGMGEVYRARDTRLGREVAIKVLPAAFAEAPDRLLRFEREARVVSLLKHSHICVLHDVGRDENVNYLVMELIEGQSLAHRLAGGALPLDQALQRGIEIADALSAAHRQGIVHRDLKPANVMLTKAGAKLLDFGLATITDVTSAGIDITHTGTLTEPGAVLGTPRYMAPEQIEGKPTDARTDIFACGCVLYEMLAGKHAFEGAGPASVSAAILKDEPAPMGSGATPLPWGLERLVLKCLAKEPDSRWQTATDLRDELKWIAERDEPV